jgi:branched-chain amino acid aminotransferase
VSAAIWINGEDQSAAMAHVSARDRGLTLSDGLFETMHARNGVIFRLDRHLDRLQYGLATLGIPVPGGLRAWVERAATVDDVSMRLTVTRGVGPAGLSPPDDVTPTVIITTAAFPAFPAETYTHGLSASVAAGRRNQRAMTAGLKTLAYADSIVALLEARRRGDDEALFLDTDDHLSEATASNIFAMVDGVLLTPPIACGALPGITREAVMEIAALRGVRVEERAFGVDVLRRATEAFLTSSLRKVAPLVRVDGLPIGAGVPGATTATIADAYATLVVRETTAR